MQRTHGVSCSGASPTRARWKSRVSSADGSSGTTPVGGSTTIALRALLFGLSLSAQCSGGFTSDGLRPAPLLSNDVSSKFTHVPWRSGWPSAVRATVQPVARAPCASVSADATTNAPSSTAPVRMTDGDFMFVPSCRVQGDPAYVRTSRRTQATRPTLVLLAGPGDQAYVNPSRR